MTLADQGTNSIHSDNANMAGQGNVAMKVTQSSGFLIGLDIHNLSLRQLFFWPYNGEIQKVIWPVGGLFFTKTI